MSDTPKRVQLSRAKGSRLPANTKSVARPTRWGNPFVVDATAGIFLPGKYVDYSHVDAWTRWPVADAATAVHAFRESRGKSASFIADVKAELRGKSLACWCPIGQPCHADVLLEIANSERWT